MYGVFHARFKQEDTFVQIGKQFPKIVNENFNWKWMGIFTPFDELGWGQLRAIRKVCKQRNSIWYGYSSHVWIKKIEYKLLQQELNKFMKVLVNCQDCD